MFGQYLVGGSILVHFHFSYNFGSKSNVKFALFNLFAVQVSNIICNLTTERDLYLLSKDQMETSLKKEED